MAGKEDEFVQRRQSSSQVARDGIRSGSDSDSVLAECGKRISADADRNQQKPPAHRTKIAYDDTCRGVITHDNLCC
jgi:hypothetical protein